MFSTRPRMTGLSGLPTEDMVRQIMQAESIRHTNMLRRVTLTSFRQEAFRGVALNIRAFEANVLSMTSQNTIRLGRSFAANASSVTLNGTAVSTNALRVTTAANAAVGSHSFRVEQRAEAHRAVGVSMERFSPAMSGELDLEALLAVGEEGLTFNISHDGTAFREITLSRAEIRGALQLGEGNVPATGWEGRLAGVIDGKLLTNFGRSTLNGEQNVSASFRDGKLNINVQAGHRAQIQLGAAAFNAIGIAHNTRTADPDFTSMRLFNATEPIPTHMYVAGARINLDRNMTIADLMERIAGSGADTVLEFDRDNSNFTLRRTRYGAFTGEFLDANAKTVMSRVLGGGEVVHGTHARIVGDTPLRTGVTDASTVEELTGFAGTFDFTINGREIEIEGGTTVRELRTLLAEAGLALTLDESNGRFTLTSNLPGSDRIRLDARAEEAIGMLLGNANILGGTDAPTATPERIVGNTARTGVTGASTVQQLTGFAGTFDFTINGEEIRITGDTRVDELTALLAEADVRLTFDSNGVFSMESTIPGSDRIRLDANAVEAVETLLGNANILPGRNVVPGWEEHEGQNAIVFINGNERHFATNNIEVAAGVNVTIGADVEIGAVHTVDVTRNTEEIRNTILNFVEEYNKLMRTLNDLIRTPRPRSSTTNQFYEPLTDEERRNLSESEVRMWDERAREGLLHRNSTIENIMRNMRMGVANHVVIDDGEGGTRRISLSMIGITTTNRHADGGVLEIDMERLDRWLQDDPDAVARMFTQQPASDATGETRRLTSGIGTRLNDIVNNAIGSRGTITRIAGSEEWASSLNDNNMLRDIRNQNTRIDIVLQQLQRREEQLWRMFSRMETAMMQADQQMMSLMAMMGQGMMG